MRHPTWRLWLILSLLSVNHAHGQEARPLPAVARGWAIEQVIEAPAILFPTAIVSAPDGTIYLGQDPMDMPGPPTEPIDSVVAIRDGKVRVFADKLWAVMGLEWADDTLYVVHAPYLSAFRDTDGDGRADERTDLMTGLGPKIPGFSGINDHVASGMRLGLDGFLYIAVGDKGIPRGVGRDGKVIQLKGGGVIRIRPDGSDVQVVSTGERNPLSVALSKTDEIFTYGNDDDSKKWPNSLTHHIVGAHFGYPYEFLNEPERSLPVLAGQIGGSGTQGVCFNEDGLPERYRGDLYFADWGLQTVFRYKVEPAGATFRVVEKEALVEKGPVSDFRPFSVGVGSDRSSLYVVDWGFMGWLASGPQTGRLYRLRYVGDDRVAPAPGSTRPTIDSNLNELDHPAHSIRMAAQRRLARGGVETEERLIARLLAPSAGLGRLHALWALDSIGGERARGAIRRALSEPDRDLRLQAIRSAGIRRDGGALAALVASVADRDPVIRREAAIALGALGDPSTASVLLERLGDPDRFVAWAIRDAIRRIDHWDESELTRAILDPVRGADAIALADQVYRQPVVRALELAFMQGGRLDPSRRIELMKVLSRLYRQYPDWSGNWFGTNPLAGEFPARTRDWDPEAMAVVARALARGLSDSEPAVRRAAVAGLLEVGPPASPALTTHLAGETDPECLAQTATALGLLGAEAATRELASLASNPGRSLEVRQAALDALCRLQGREAATARLAIAFDQNSPAPLVARAVETLGRLAALPPNDLAGFFYHDEAIVRAAALRAVSTWPANRVPADTRDAILTCLEDAEPRPRRAAIEAAGRLQLSRAIPSLIRIAAMPEFRSEAILSLCSIPDRRAVSLFLQALSDRDTRVRKAAEHALIALRDQVQTELLEAARSGQITSGAAVALERILARFRPITGWKVIGPFARTTAQVFIGERSIDLDQSHSGVEGRSIRWADRPADPRTGRVILNDFKEGSGDRGGFGYDTNGSPDLAAFGYVELESEQDREAMLLVGSSGSLILTLNEEVVHTYNNFAGRGYAPDSDLIRVKLKKGTNRLLIRSRQGIGVWSFGVQVSEPSEVTIAGRARSWTVEELRQYALRTVGDAARGEELFFDEKGVGCVRCHSAKGRGTSNIGPDLTGLALKYDKAELIRSVLEPSSRIATGYQPQIVALTDGRIVSGVLRSETPTHLELADSEAKVVRLAKDEIEEQRVGDISIMPAGLVESLSPEDFADLLAYLVGLREMNPAAPQGSRQPSQDGR